MHVFSVSVRQLLFVLLLLFATAGSAFAQTIRGRAVAAGTGLPLAGAIVQVRKADSVIATTLTSQNGSFLITGVEQGTYVLRVLRIGFRPFESAAVTVGNEGIANVAIEWTGEAVSLMPRIIAGGRTCRVSADSGTMIANVWDEARKALLSSVLAEAGDAPLIARTNYARTLSLKDNVVEQQQLSSFARRSFRAYASWAPESLAANGYVSEQMFGDRIAKVYRAPDAGTLISDSFAGTHCFSLVRGTGAHESDVGLAFEPSRKTDVRVDIRGTFWVERATSQLKRIEFSYVGLPSYVNAAKSGGWVDFVTLSSGQVLLSRWNIRMPHLVARQTNDDNPDRAVFRSVDESGGLVTSVTSGDSMIFEQRLPSLTMHLKPTAYLRDRNGVKVELAGTELRATTNRDGTVIFRNLFPGRYAVRTNFANLAMLGSHASEQSATVAGIDVADSIVLPTARTLLKSACGNRADRSGTVALFGTVRDSVGVIVEGDAGIVVAHEIAGRDSVVPQGGLIDANSQFLICDAKPGEVRLYAETDAGFGQTSVAVPTNQMVQEVALRALPMRPQTLSTTPPNAAASIEFRVIDTAAEPMPRVRIFVDVGASKPLEVVTNQSGRGVIAGLPVGDASISAGEVRRRVTVQQGRNFVQLTIDVVPP